MYDVPLLSQTHTLWFLTRLLFILLFGVWQPRGWNVILVRLPKIGRGLQLIDRPLAPNIE